MIKALSIASLVALPLVSAVVVVDPNNLPYKAGGDLQTGYNNCTGRPDSPSSQCQTVVINDGNDFCLFGMPGKNMQVGPNEERAVAWCTKPSHGARLIPHNTIKTLHFIQTPDFIQITGRGNLTRLLIAAGDDGGEMDPHGPRSIGNPIGGLVIGKDPRPGKNFGKLIQYREWSNFMSDDEFCMRACFHTSKGPKAHGDKKWCEHKYDIEGCWWNQPGKYIEKGFDSCQADAMPFIGVYNGTSTYTRGVGTQPPPHPRPKSSLCSKISSPDNRSYPKTPATTPTPKASTKSSKGKRHFGEHGGH